MRAGSPGGTFAFGTLLIPVLATLALPAPVAAQATFTRDIAPILQRSCQNCHRGEGVAPMALETYEQVRPWARAIKTRTGLGPKAGVMPPWYLERNIGIQHYKNDRSLSPEEVTTIAQWVDSGAPLGNPADMPPPRRWDDASVWSIGTPDLVVSVPNIVVKAGAADSWSEANPIPIPLDLFPEDRYVAAVEIKEVNDVPPQGERKTVGGRYVVHHMSWSTRKIADTQDVEEDDGTGTGWPVHEVGRNADFFDPKAGRLLEAGSSIVPSTLHLHSSGRDTTARLDIGFKLHPKGYTPEYPRARTGLGDGMNIDIMPNQDNQTVHAYAVLQENTKIVTFEPHLHAPGDRMCMEAIWGNDIQTIACAGYDHNWVLAYAFDDDHAPLLPKGTIVHIVGFMDNTPANTNVIDPRNWSGSGNRSVANMFIDLGIRVAMSDEQLEQEMAQRRERLNIGPNDNVIGCPLCNVGPKPGYVAAPAPTTSGN